MKSVIPSLTVLTGTALIALSAIPHSSFARMDCPLPDLKSGESKIIFKQDQAAALIADAYFAAANESQLPSKKEMQRTCYSNLIRQELAIGGYNEYELKSFLRDPFSNQLIATLGCGHSLSTCDRSAIIFNLKNKTNGAIYTATTHASASSETWTDQGDSKQAIAKYSCWLSRLRVRDGKNEKVDSITFSMDRAYPSRSGSTFAR